jgi:Ser/Thr protein kinase RdoA (MazF antagonist)
MEMNNEEAVYAAARVFTGPDKVARAIPYGSGHINDTYRVFLQDGSADRSFILQRINHHIFKNPVALMENIERVTAHMCGKLNGSADGDRRALRLLPSHHGKLWHEDDGGNYWRAYNFIGGAKSYDAVETVQQAYQAGRAFGNFQEMLADLPEPRLHESIRDFHNTPKRFAAFQEAVEADVANRAASAKPEIEFAMARGELAGRLLEADLPDRVTHNDTKLNNVLIDDATGEGICVIDLDTVMPGLAAYDFGDMVRTTTSPAKEDEQDLSKVKMDLAMFEALLRGYLDAAGRFLTTGEKEVLAFSGKLITFEIGIRFLTDYLSGDTYFKVHRPGHNLDRARTQFKLIESIEEQESAMEGLVRTFT